MASSAHVFKVRSSQVVQFLTLIHTFLHCLQHFLQALWKFSSIQSSNFFDYLHALWALKHSKSLIAVPPLHPHLTQAYPVYSRRLLSVCFPYLRSCATVLSPISTSTMYSNRCSVSPQVSRTISCGFRASSPACANNYSLWPLAI